MFYADFIDVDDDDVRKASIILNLINSIKTSLIFIMNWYILAYYLLFYLNFYYELVHPSIFTLFTFYYELIFLYIFDLVLQDLVFQLCAFL